MTSRVLIPPHVSVLQISSVWRIARACLNPLLVHSNEMPLDIYNSPDKDWPDEVSEALLKIARSGQLIFVRQLMAESDLEEQLFPLVRAIDYLKTGDAALIEKLSPEVKGIVEKVVETLRTVTQDAAVPQA
jgi:hypothetical protein